MGLAPWTAMMAAMMLPGAIPAAVRLGRAGLVAAVPAFTAMYLAVWAVVALAAYALYRPPGTVAAGSLIVTAAAYELTPLKRACRQRCRGAVRSGLGFGIYCVGSSIGLMVMLLALGAMSVAWSCAIGAVVLAQKLLPPRALLDVPVALAILALGLTVALT